MIESLDCGTRELPDKSFHCRLGLAATPGCWIHHSRDISNKTFQAGPPQHPALLPGLLKVDDVGEVGQARGALLAVPAPVGILTKGDRGYTKNQNISSTHVGGSLGGQKVGDELWPSWPCHPS